MNNLLAGEFALVTGASRGIGQAILTGLAEAGAHVVGTATSQGGADAITARLAEQGHKGHGAVLDVSDPASIKALLANLETRGELPGILVNNAGITRDGLAMRMSDEDWGVILDTNLTSAFRMGRACLRHMMRARKGRIISISSVVASTGNPGQCNYAAAKAGMEGLTRALAREVGSRNITVNAVAPGFIDTDMTRALPEEARKSLTGQIPLGRLGDPKDVAAAVVFLASPVSAYITGTTLHVNGGMYM